MSIKFDFFCIKCLFTETAFFFFGACFSLCADPCNAILHFPKEVFSKNNISLLNGDDFLMAELPEKAIESYLKIIGDHSSLTTKDPHILQTLMQSRFHLAQAYLLQKSYQNAIKPLQNNIDSSETLSPELETIRQNSIYLLALIYKELGRFDDALEMFEQYIVQSKTVVQPLHHEAQFNIALLYFLKQEMPKALAHFETLSPKPSSHLAFLRQIYLARIHISQKDYTSAISILNSLAEKLPQTDLLERERAFLLGKAYFQNHQYQEASNFFANALPNRFPESCPWYRETLFSQGWCHLNLADALSCNSIEQTANFEKAESLFQQLADHQHDEKVYLALGQYYLIRAKRSNDQESYAKAEKILSQKDHFTTVEGQTSALLLRAEAAPNYPLRNSLYQQIIIPENNGSSSYAKGWFLHGLNDFEEGQKYVNQGNFKASNQLFIHSAKAFKNASTLLKEHDFERAIAALKYQALATSYNDITGNEDAFHLLNEMIHSHQELLNASAQLGEFYYLRGFYGLQMTKTYEEESFKIAEKSLKDAAALPNSEFGDIALNQLAAWHYRNQNYEAAENIYLQIVDLFPNSPICPNAHLWSAYCAEKLQKDSDIVKDRKRKVYEQFPQSPSAAEASFKLYSYQEYLQGDREALKHLQQFTKKYESSPYLIEAYYLIGLDSKRNRKTLEGKWIRKKSLTDAIEAFQNGESIYHSLIETSAIPSEKTHFYKSVNHQIVLERAKANLNIANESQGAKKQIYLEYAEDVFKNLMSQLDKEMQPHSFSPLYEECVFCLAQAYIKREKDADAEDLLNRMSQQYSDHKITENYYLSRIKYELGKIAHRQNNPQKALKLYIEAEEAAKGELLSTHEKLDLWIQQSASQKDLQKWDESILLLSKVANDDAISPLRLKAMYLRSDIYESQGRPELARKQLESLAKKGGEWAQKAQERLEKNYGY